MPNGLRAILAQDLIPPVVQIPHPVFSHPHGIWNLVGGFWWGGLVETFGSWCFSLLLHLVFYSLDVQKLFHFGLDPELIANQLVRIFSFGPDHKARQDPQMWGFKPLIYPRRLRGKRFFARSVARCRPVLINTSFNMWLEKLFSKLYKK